MGIANAMIVNMMSILFAIFFNLANIMKYLIYKTCKKIRGWPSVLTIPLWVVGIVFLSHNQLLRDDIVRGHHADEVDAWSEVLHVHLATVVVDVLM